MRESLLIGSMLNNCESWINLFFKSRKIGNARQSIRHVLTHMETQVQLLCILSLVFFLPVQIVIMKKRLKFRYILNESIDSMIRKVSEVLKTDSRKGDFVDLVNQDIKDNDIDLAETDIQNMSKLQWKKIYRHQS